MSSDIISISNRVFLSEGHYATDRTGNDLIFNSEIKSNKTIQNMPTNLTQHPMKSKPWRNHRI